MVTPPKSSPASVAAEALLRAEEALSLNAETNRMVKEMHQALMQPQPGHDETLLERMAQVTIAAETGKAVGDRIIWGAKVIGALAAISTAFYAAVNFGHPPKP